MVGLSYVIRLVLEFWSLNPEFIIFIFPFSKFLSLVSFFRFRVSVRIRVKVRF